MLHTSSPFWGRPAPLLGVPGREETAAGSAVVVEAERGAAGLAAAAAALFLSYI